MATTVKTWKLSIDKNPKRVWSLFSLSDLNLNEKQIKSLALLSKTFSHISHLYLEKSDITEIWKHTFQDMKNLEHISLKNTNKLTKIHPGSFDNLPKLKHIGFIGSKFDDGRCVCYPNQYSTQHTNSYVLAKGQLTRQNLGYFVMN